ncbi:hypothetical protein D3C71_2020480 [compost metagenome]
MTSRTFMSPQAESASSGTYFVTSASGSILPSCASWAAMSPVKDLVTENSRCGVQGFIWLS